MKNISYPLSSFCLRTAIALSGVLIGSVMTVSAKPANRVVGSRVNLIADSAFVQGQKFGNCEGAYRLKNGVLDEITNLKFVLPANQSLKSAADTLLNGKRIAFEQKRVMILPTMGMVHFVGILDIDGVKNTTHFQLSFVVNEDESIHIKGSKKIKLSDFTKEAVYTADIINPNDEVTLDVNLLLKQDNITLAF